ncbi:hypothetical protein HN51_039062 [Arachis hypogaea]|uniref:BRO1 domain-containing protein n=1 Tax=Arachis hypogaea TaxID=3818 RepID=A0A444YHQ1_ARAHY|nr:uncharacterized protein LOC107645498 [Arachis ipaensis]XP_025662831.1 uncharacterized protein LOC112758381 [Arachis hypogaea]QHN84518.1 uncharacterized protein DS421_16g529310 [Arachis hypogaea]RYR01417.1 hypothetical protein Ahy_B06g080280 [Arachis hypogaea]
MSNDDGELLNLETMLSIPLKKTDPVELYLPLRKLVASKYSESDAQKVESVLETLNKCRMDMVERRGDLSLPMQRDCLIHYFKCLCMVEPLFSSLSSDADADADPIIFVWYDASNPEHQDGVSSERNAIQLEKAAVLFNLGAIYSQIAADCDRTSDLGRHLAMESFKVAANFFFQLWKVFAKDVVSATLDLTLPFAELLHYLFSAQASELELQLQLKNKDASYALRQYGCARLFISVRELYFRASYVILRVFSVAEWKYNYPFDQGPTWKTHIDQKVKFLEAELTEPLLVRQSFTLHKSLLAEVYSSVNSCDAECVTEILVRGICRKPNLQQIYLDLLLSEFNPFKIVKDGKLVANPWDMPPPYPTNSAILSSLVSRQFSDVLAYLPLKKSEPLNLYESLRNYFVLKYSESVAKKVEGLLKMLHKLRNEMLRDDLSLPFHRDCLIRYFKCLCMIEPFFPMNASPNPPIFVWFNAISPQQDSYQHNIHLEKASVLFNLVALCTRIALSCDVATIQGQRLAMGALNDASNWFSLLRFESKKASGTIDLSEPYTTMIGNKISKMKLKFPHSQSDGSSLPGYPASAYVRSTFGLLGEDQFWTARYLEDKIKACHDETDPSDVTEQFLLGYCKSHSLLQEVSQPPCLDLLSEVSPVKIKDGNLVANASMQP